MLAGPGSDWAQGGSRVGPQIVATGYLDRARRARADGGLGDAGAAVARGGLRPAGGRGDGGRPAGRVLARLGARRGRGRRGEPRGPARRERARARRSSACSRTAPSPPSCAAAASSAAAPSSGATPPRARSPSTARSLAARPLVVGIDGRELAGTPDRDRPLPPQPAAALARDGRRALRLLQRPARARPGARRTRGSTSGRSATARARGLVWQEWILPAAARADAIDVFFSPAYSCPLRLDRPRVTAVHDLSFFAYPQDFTLADALRRRALVAASLRASRRVAVCSDFTARELGRLFPDLAERARAHPARRRRRPARAARARRGPRRARRDAARCVLSVGAILNRRCLPELLRAVVRLRDRHPGLRARPRRREPHPPPARPRRDRRRSWACAPSVRLSGFVDDARARAALRGRRRLRRALGVRGLRPARARGGRARPAAGRGSRPVAGRDLPRRRAAGGLPRRGGRRARARPRARRRCHARDARRRGPRRSRPATPGPRRRASRARRSWTRPADERGPKVAVVIVSFETRDTLVAGLAALEAERRARRSRRWSWTTPAATARPTAVRARFPGVRVIANAENVGFARACNQGAARDARPASSCS